MNNKLIKCPACGRDVSAGAAKCPHCGEPTRKRRMLIAIICIGIALWLSADLIGTLFGPLLEPLLKNLP